MSFYDPLSGSSHHFGKKEEPTPAPWLLTVADLLSLLLTFFIMLFAMSSVKQEQWERVNQSLYQVAKRPVDEIVKPQGADKSVERITLMEGRNLAYIQYSLQSKVEALNLPYAFERQKDMLVLSLPLKDIATANTLSAQGIGVLEKIGQAIAHQTNAVSVKTIAARGSADAWENAVGLSSSIGVIFHQQGYEAPVPAEASLAGANESPHIEIIVRETVANFSENR